MNENKVPSNFSSLNNQVIPDERFLEEIEKYTPKLSEDIIKQICEEKGLISSDPRMYHKYIYLYQFLLIAFVLLH